MDAETSRLFAKNHGGLDPRELSREDPLDAIDLIRFAKSLPGCDWKTPPAERVRENQQRLSAELAARLPLRAKLKGFWWACRLVIPRCVGWTKRKMGYPVP